MTQLRHGMPSSASLRLFLITNSPAIARFAVQNGVDRVFVDLEIIGKAERQGHLDTVISRHSMDDVAAIRHAIPQSELMVRLNPLNGHSEFEIDSAVRAGADILMLPMYRSADEVRAFEAHVGGRARICLLAETPEAMETLDVCSALEGVSEVHIGLNDLSLALGRRFMFELMVDGTVEQMAATLRKVGKPFGIGGLARVGEGLLPAEMIVAEHVRMGSTAAILSRTFHRQSASVEEIQEQMDFSKEVAALRQCFAEAGNTPVRELEQNRQAVREIVESIARALPDRGKP